MNHGSLFSGIGGFDLAAEWMGWNNVFHCEINPFCQKILKYYWPDAETYTDITKTDFSVWRGKIDILTGGFPCQPYSQSGKRLGKEDDRHLWPEMLRAIREIAPRWIVGENVRGLVNWSEGLVFEEVQADLEAEGYKIQPVLLPAASVGAPHERYRIWFIAYSNNSKATRQRKDSRGLLSFSKAKGSDLVPKQYAANPSVPRLEELQCVSGNNGAEQPAFKRNGDWWRHWPTQSAICRRDDGVPNRVDRIKALGNAVVPQVVLQIFKTIEDYDKHSPRSNKEHSLQQPPEGD